MPAADPCVGRTVTVTAAGVLATIVLFAVAAGCVRLGFWQLDRHAQRRAANELLEQRITAPALTDVDALRDSAGLAYRTAVVSGTLDHEHTIALAGRSFQGAPGVHLLTPLRLGGRPEALLVNRGWVPAADGATVDFAFFATTRPGIVRGVLLPFPRGTGARVARADAAAPGSGAFQRVWFTVDQERLRAQFPYALFDIVLQIVPEGVQTTAPLPLTPPVVDAGPHLGYAIQWFSFAFIGIIGWGALVLHRRDRRRTRPVAGK